MVIRASLRDRFFDEPAKGKLVSDLLKQHYHALDHTHIVAPPSYGRIVRSLADATKLPNLDAASTFVGPVTPEMLTTKPLDDKVVLDVNEEPKG